mmetsp:Transcript_127121/g.345108  ORF Transcript_127121/g.345108 Transcript_127121/m.345108 type:complete len:293 (+) Transcript_127121:251-1129(+)
MVSSFFAFSAVRSSVASAMAASNSAISSVSLATSEANLAMELSSWSFSAWRASTCAVFSFRVCSLVDSSVSHQLLCSASSEASSISRVISSLIICLTFPKGSASTRVASMDSTLLPVLPACWRRKSTTRFWAGACASERRAASECPPTWVCASVGRCFSAYPVTVSPLIISMAFSMATSSSARSCWRDSNWSAFAAQVACRLARYFLSSSRVAIVSSISACAAAASSRSLARAGTITLRRSLALPIWAVRSLMRMSNSSAFVLSWFSMLVRSPWNLSRSFSSISMMPWAWNS